ncbi:MAG: ROK family protein, partial [Chloroflexota bacterium]
VTQHLGIDLGVTNLKWAVVERARDAWTILDRGQVPTVASDGTDAVIERIGGTAASLLERWPDATTLGLGVPGRYDPNAGSIRFLVNMPGDWVGRPVGPPVAARLGLPVTLINDARAFGVAELRLGVARGASSMIGITLGTGVGGVIAIDGRVYLGHDGTGGEIGHTTVDPDGPRCGCGDRGCLEAFAAAHKIAAACGTETAEAGVVAARAGDPQALAGFAEVGRWIGIALANMVTIVTPDVVVIGGGVAAAGDLLLDPICAEIRRRVFMTSVDDVEVVTAQLGTWAGAIGAGVHGAEMAVTR